MAQRALFVFVGRLERFIQEHGHAPLAAQRSKTLGQILRNAITLVVFGTLVLDALAILGWDVRPLLAGAGIVGIAIGFGAQTLVRDVISGLVILAENQFAVGDLIEVNGKPATVEAIRVRWTQLRDFNGFVYFVPNGEMKVVVNRSRDWNRATVDIGVPVGEDVDLALAVCREIAGAMSREPEWEKRLLDPIVVWGLESSGTADVFVRMMVRTRPGGDLPETSRELRLRVVRALSGAGVRTSSAAAPSRVPIPSHP